MTLKAPAKKMHLKKVVCLSHLMHIFANNIDLTNVSNDSNCVDLGLQVLDKADDFCCNLRFCACCNFHFWDYYCCE